ncbi:DUF4296 domain-containing protein [Mucilaginibacter antarcticus]|uniref:DUF4296 domain-containing protein n=1 Tax=Mucilaginibacter antarcticus TaxID=1855725 RepID=UPI00362FDBF9
MRKHIILFFSALLVLGACKYGGGNADVLGEDDMVSLLVDVHMMDGYLASQPNNDSLYRYGTGRYLYIFKQHHTDSATFKRSMKHYTMRDEVLVKIYEEVNKRLLAKNDSIVAVIAKDQKNAERQAKNAQKDQERKAKLRQDSINKRYQDDLKGIKRILSQEQKR